MCPPSSAAARSSWELKAAIGEPVEVVTKGFWPSARIPGLVAQWLDEEQPDLLLITATAYPFAYPLVPLRVAGLLGPLGSPVRRAGVGAANTPWIAHNQVFRGLRRFAQLTIGGAYYLSVEEVIANTSEAVRVAVRHEDVVVVLKVPGATGAISPRLERRTRRRPSASGCSIRWSASAPSSMWTSFGTTSRTTCATPMFR
jgi:hypothetical protein